MRKLAAFILALSLVLPAFSAARKKGRATRKPSTAATQKSSKSIAGAKLRAGATKKSAKSRRSVKSRQTWRSGQMQPTPDRYQEIQQALIVKGYLAPPATGIWEADSVSALKKFQADQKLEPTGKLDSLTLISLGLGPRRDRTTSANVASASLTSSGSNK